MPKTSQKTSREGGKNVHRGNQSQSRVKQQKNKLNNKADKEEKLKKKREAEQKRRQKIRDNPEAHQAYCKAERQRNEKRKKEGRIKSVNELTIKEKKIRRDKQKVSQKNSRMRRNVLSSIHPHTDDLNNNSVTKQAKVGRKRIARHLRQSYRNNMKLKNENQSLKKTVNKLRKRIARSKPKAPQSTSPCSKVKKFLNGRRIDPDINQKLIGGEVIVQQMRKAYSDSKSDKFKQILGRVLCGKVVRKYRKLKLIRTEIAPIVPSRITPTDDLLKYTRNETVGSKFLKDKIKRFYEENSQIDPGKKNCKEVNGQLVSKHHMNASIKDLYLKFCATNSFRVSYSLFAKHRPSHCVAPKVSARNTCACLTHENFGLLVSALHRLKILEENSTEKIINRVTCDHRLEQCLARTCEGCVNKQVEYKCQNVNFADEMFYMKWETKREECINEKTQKPMVVSITKKNKITCQVKEGLDLFSNQLKLVMAHEFRVFHQKKVMKTLITNLENDEMVVLMDFSENYACKYGTEVHSVHFGASREQYTLHTGVLYLPGLTKGFATVSESLRYDPAAILAHLMKILDSFLPQHPEVKILHLLSDSPSTQYRNRKMFHLITQYLPQEYHQIDQITHNFSEAGHGKGPADGIGGSLKMTADNQVKYGHDVSNFKTFVTILRTRVQAVHIDTVTIEDIPAVDAVLPTDVRPFTGTMKVHQYTWDRENSSSVCFNSLSCFHCALGKTCSHFNLGSTNYHILSKPRRTSMIRNEKKTRSSVPKTRPPKSGVLTQSEKKETKGKISRLRKKKQEISEEKYPSSNVFQSETLRRSSRLQRRDSAVI